MDFPVLYKRDSKGRIREWCIFVEHSDNLAAITTVHGLKDGKKQTDVVTVTEGKNQGKVNETTFARQAELDAESAWNYQVERQGYTAILADVDIETRPSIDPMLAHRYDQHPDKVEFPCYVQPKLNGHRCLAVWKDAEIKLYSRKREQITGLPHVVIQLTELAVKHHLEDGFVFDGELYNHDLGEKFEELSGYIRSKEPKIGCAVVQYHIYDHSYCDTNRKEVCTAFITRIQTLLGMNHNLTGPIASFPALHVVTTMRVQNEAEMLALFKQFRSEGYEGLMIRNLESPYQFKRSYHLQKVKEFQDAEFKIVDVVEGQGRMAGHAIFVCVTAEGKEFRAKMKGSMERLRHYFLEHQALLGKYVTVAYQSLTKEGIPLFPVALHLRDDV